MRTRVFILLLVFTICLLELITFTDAISQSSMRHHRHEVRSLNILLSLLETLPKLKLIISNVFSGKKEKETEKRG